MHPRTCCIELPPFLPPMSGRIAREEHRHPCYAGILLPTAQTSRGQHHQNHALHVLEVQGVVEGRLQLSMQEVVASSISIISDIAISGVFIRKERRKEASIWGGAAADVVYLARCRGISNSCCASIGRPSTRSSTVEVL